MALLRAQKVLASVEKGLDKEQAAGVSIVRRALEEPLRRIAENAGIEGSVVVNKVQAQTGSDGFKRRHREVPRPAESRRH